MKKLDKKKIDIKKYAKKVFRTKKPCLEVHLGTNSSSVRLQSLAKSRFTVHYTPEEILGETKLECIAGVDSN